MNFQVKSLLLCIFLTTCLSSSAMATASAARHFSPANGVYIATVPKSWTIQTDYTFNALGPGHPLPGVLFSIPQSEAAGTNLSSLGTGVAVVTPSAQQPCNARDYLATARDSIELGEAGTLWTLARATDVGAGTKSTTQIFARRVNGHCLLVLYLVHTTDLSAYPKGSVRPYDQVALMRAFDQLRHSLLPATSASITAKANAPRANGAIPQRRH
jgi:hypothetical protein